MCTRTHTCTHGCVYNTASHVIVQYGVEVKHCLKVVFLLEPCGAPQRRAVPLLSQSSFCFSDYRTRGQTGEAVNHLDLRLPF